jgi:hypothetical protein
MWSEDWQGKTDANDRPLQPVTIKKITIVEGK